MAALHLLLHLQGSHRIHKGPSVRNRGDEPRAARTLLGEHSPMIVGPDWGGFVAIRVKTHRAMALPGNSAFISEHFEVPEAIGVIEISGARQGSRAPDLWAGFSLAAKLPAATFVLHEHQAIGTLVLPGALFQAWLTLLAKPAYFRIGGDGQGNAISSELSFLSVDRAKEKM